MPRPHLFTWPVTVLALALAPRPALAADSPRAQYAKPEELEPEGMPHQLEVSVGAEFTHVIDRASPDRLAGLQNIVTGALATRLLVGSRLAYSAGLDGYAGGSDTGPAYGATLYPVGIGLRGGRGAFVSLSGGVGIDRVVGSVPLGALFPVELLVAFPLGPLRPLAWARTFWIAGAPERRQGAPTTSAVDALEAGVALRIGSQRSYWKDVNAGAGPSVGVFYREFMGARALGFSLAFNLSGGQ